MTNIIVTVYLTLVIACYLDIISNISIMKNIKMSAPSKQRASVVKNIESLESLKKYCVLWPYVIYKISRENER
jgi:hypothetical protein